MSAESVTHAREVLAFWFDDIEPSAWWQKDADFDRVVAQRFGDLHRSAAAGELWTWRASATGRLAEIVVLDQFSRNLGRGKAAAFAHDPMALALAQEAVARKADQALTSDQRSFLYMPYMHSESRRIHEVAVTLFDQPGLEKSLDFEHRHKAIIDRFGRYPHRNEVLGRRSTPEEIEFLTRPGSSF